MTRMASVGAQGKKPNFLGKIFGSKKDVEVALPAASIQGDIPLTSFPPVFMATESI